MINEKEIVTQLLGSADIQINGNRPWDLHVLDERFHKRVLADNSLGLGEAYMEGWWKSQKVDETIYRMLQVRLRQQVKQPIQVVGLWLMAKIANRQNKRRSKEVAEVHYNLNNDLYRHMLGSTMAYTCGYWKNTNSLDQAQINKYDLICRKLDLKPQDEVLELGCGWGGFAKYAAEQYGCHVVAVNISEEQVKYAREHCPDSVDVKLCDYRDVHAYNPTRKQFDKVVSIGMCEHVGVKNYKRWFQIVLEQMKEYSLFLLHTIGSDEYLEYCEPWLDKYIFPNGVLPSPKSLGTAVDGLFILEDWHDFGAYYDNTLMAWHENFEPYWQSSEEVRNAIVPYPAEQETFYRMWKYYLLSLAGAFRARYVSLWQLVLSKKGVRGVYSAVR